MSSKYKQSFKINGKQFSPLNEKQREYLTLLQQKTITIGEGPAGTGKSFIAILFAAYELLQKNSGFKQIVFIRPVVESGRGLGYLKGTTQEKIEPFFRPMHDNLKQIIGGGKHDCLVRNRSLIDMPLEHIRGLTFDDSFIILDEAQNATPHQIKTALTRIGKNSKMVINGDSEQGDIKNSGLIFTKEALMGMRQFGLVEFTEDDIVRNALIKQILIRFRKKERLSK